MTGSVILATTTRLLILLLLLLSLFLLFRGHNEPGGGFIGGLVGAAAYALYAIAYGVRAARYALRFDPRLLLGAGVALALFSGLLAALAGVPFLAGQWLTLYLFGQEIKVGSVLLFDIGVYLVVIGAVLTMVFSLEEL